ncbi:MAG: serine hydrolase domain-containing protein [Janthinobacterium lividum]
MFIRLLQLGSLFIGLLMAAGPVAAQSATTRQVVAQVRATYQLPALLAAVIQPEGIIYLGGGVRHNDAADTIGPDDYFHLGSETKGVTSLLAGKLVEEGKIKWKSRLVEVVPELKDKIRTEYAAVTLDKLLSHRAGIHPYMWSRDHKALPTLVGTVSERRLQFAAFVLQQPSVSATPGKSYAYSNAGYVLAALMLERASGSTWEDLLAATFGQLKLRYLLGFPNRHDAQQPWGHHLVPVAGSSRDSTLVPLGPTNRYQGYDYMAPAMELSMPLPDFARLVQLHLLGLLGQDNYLKSSTYQTIHFGKQEYAYGWAVSGLASRGTLRSMHDGTTRTFYCHTVLYPDQRIAFVVLTNAGGTPAKKACHELAQDLWKRYLLGQL